MSYQKVIDAMNAHDLSWRQIDRIHLQQETYDDFHDRWSQETANYKTDDTAAVRLTTGDEAIYHVTPDGRMNEIKL